MHFYGWTWEQIMKTPLKRFWTLLKTMYRIQAQDSLRWVHILSMPHISEDGRKEFIERQLQTLGVIQLSDERDASGIDKLKALGG